MVFQEPARQLRDPIPKRYLLWIPARAFFNRAFVKTNALTENALVIYGGGSFEYAPPFKAGIFISSAAIPKDHCQSHVYCIKVEKIYALIQLLFRRFK
jgi:hypothetical protein